MASRGNICVPCANPVCSQVVFLKPYRLIRSKKHYCSFPCRTACLPPPRPPEERFWTKVTKTESCWLWTGYRDKRGYGQFVVSATPRCTMLVHRYSYELAYGCIFENICVLHRCDTPPCVRPDHLFLGTRTDNSADAKQKGRLRGAITPLRGEEVPSARLTVADVYAIDALKGILPATHVGNQFHVSQNAVLCIWHRKTWKHLFETTDRA